MESGQSTPSIPENRTDPQSPARYKAVRSSNRKGPHFITCLNSDAVSSRWREVGPTVDGTGSVCYWITDDDATEAHLNRWKRTLGNALAKLLGISEGDEEWRLTELPKNYKLFRYTKGGREDVYLLGSQSVNKFRTANEFSPHVYWLCTHDPLLSGRAHCKCKYCGRVRCQSQVNLELGLSEKAKSSSEQRMVSHNKRKAEEDIAKENFRKRNISEFNQKPGPRQSYKPTQRKVLPAHIISSASNGLSSKRQTFTGPYVNKDRDRDLSEFKCAFRAAEVVWCKLDSPIDGSDGGHPDIVIEYWPAVCEERIMVSVPEILKENPDGNPPAALSTPKLKVSQNYQWKVRPLGTGDVLWRKEADLLAYLNYPVPLNFYKLLPNPKLLSHLHDGHGTDRPSITSFSTLSEAITAFALALQFSVHIKKAWTLMDRYDIAFLKRLDAIGEQLSVEDLQITYEDSTLPWYQYLWWGTEKIWSGELIRLIVSAADLPNGLRDISSRDRARCFFLKISGIYRSEQEAGMIKGPIYELADLNQREIDEKVNSSDFNEKNQPACFGRYMPEPPPGLFFRRLTPIGKEHHLVLQHIAGRYYPPHCLQSLPSHTDEDKPDPYSIDGRSLSLCGLTEGKWLHMHCETWTADRKECFKKAEALAEEELLACNMRNQSEAPKTKSVLLIEPSSDTMDLDTNLTDAHEVLMGSVVIPDGADKEVAGESNKEACVQDTLMTVGLQSEPALMDTSVNRLESTISSTMKGDQPSSQILTPGSQESNLPVKEHILVVSEMLIDDQAVTEKSFSGADGMTRSDPQLASKNFQLSSEQSADDAVRASIALENSQSKDNQDDIGLSQKSMSDNPTAPEDNLILADDPTVEQVISKSTEHSSSNVSEQNSCTVPEFPLVGAVESKVLNVDKLESTKKNPANSDRIDSKKFGTEGHEGAQNNNLIVAHEVGHDSISPVEPEPSILILKPNLNNQSVCGSTEADKSVNLTSAIASADMNLCHDIQGAPGTNDSDWVEENKSIADDFVSKAKDEDKETGLEENKKGDDLTRSSQTTLEFLKSNQFSTEEITITRPEILPQPEVNLRQKSHVGEEITLRETSNEETATITQEIGLNPLRSGDTNSELRDGGAVLSSSNTNQELIGSSSDLNAPQIPGKVFIAVETEAITSENQTSAQQVAEESQADNGLKIEIFTEMSTEEPNNEVEKLNHPEESISCTAEPNPTQHLTHVSVVHMDPNLFK